MDEILNKTGNKKGIYDSFTELTHKNDGFKGFTIVFKPR